MVYFLGAGVWLRRVGANVGVFGNRYNKDGRLYVPFAELKFKLMLLLDAR